MPKQHDHKGVECQWCKEGHVARQRRDNGQWEHPLHKGKGL